MSILDRRLNAVRPDLADAALKGTVEAARFVSGEPYHVIAAQAPVRTSPAVGSTLLTEALFGEPVRVFDRTADGWAWAQLQSDRYVGWISAKDLADGRPEATHRIAAPRTFVFSGPDIKTPPLAALPLGASVTVTGEAEDRNARYALIAPAGAVVVQHLAALDAFEADWTAVAEQFLGTPYLWGGKTSAGIDCSGLVQTALAACGIAAPRDTDMQEAALGRARALRDMSQLRRGDLVFWRGHVGMMRDPDILLHANAHHMAVAAEPLSAAVERLAGSGTEVTSIRRIRGD